MNTYAIGLKGWVQFRESDKPPEVIKTSEHRGYKLQKGVLRDIRQTIMSPEEPRLPLWTGLYAALEAGPCEGIRYNFTNIGGSTTHRLKLEGIWAPDENVPLNIDVIAHEGGEVIGTIKMKRFTALTGFGLKEGDVIKVPPELVARLLGEPEELAD